MSFTTDRNAHDLDLPKDAKLKITASHSFDPGVIVGASGEYTNNAFSDSATVKLEGTIGYRAKLGELFSVTGSAGLARISRQAGQGTIFHITSFVSAPTSKPRMM